MSLPTADIYKQDLLGIYTVQNPPLNREPINPVPSRTHGIPNNQVLGIRYLCIAGARPGCKGRKAVFQDRWCMGFKPSIGNILLLSLFPGMTTNPNIRTLAERAAQC